MSSIKARARKDGFAQGAKGVPLHEAWEAFVKVEGRAAVVAEPAAEIRFRKEHGFGLAQHRRTGKVVYQATDGEAWDVLKLVFQWADEHHEALALEDVEGAQSAWESLRSSVARVVDLARMAGIAYMRERKQNDALEPPSAREAGRLALYIKHSHALYRKHGIVRGDQLLDVQRARHLLLAAVDHRLDSRRWLGGSTAVDRDRSCFSVVGTAVTMLREAREVLTDEEILATS